MSVIYSSYQNIGSIRRRYVLLYCWNYLNPNKIKLVKTFGPISLLRQPFIIQHLMKYFVQIAEQVNHEKRWTYLPTLDFLLDGGKKRK